MPRQDQEGDGRDGGGSDGGKPPPRERDGGYWAEEEVSGGGPREGTAQLDQEVILTMLGDLEQVLHTQPRPRKSEVWQLGGSGARKVNSSGALVWFCSFLLMFTRIGLI